MKNAGIKDDLLEIRHVQDHLRETKIKLGKCLKILTATITVELQKRYRLIGFWKKMTNLSTSATLL